ncbi:hypothetical protein [Paraburkholderia sediminicola]|uniref:hypothetical protein n=1 Tax=Paraburkholderia sediminicola TaxID=458836 RepID=UPI0038B918E8
MNIGQKIKSVGMGFGVLLMLVAGLVIPFILILGMTWVSVHLVPWLKPAFSLTLLACIFILGPLAIFRRTRTFAAAGLLIASFVFGAILWIASLLLTMQLWGMLAVIIGLFMMGVGIVPVAIVAVIFHGQWSILGSIAIMLVATFGVRGLALWVGSRAL